MHDIVQLERELRCSLREKTYPTSFGSEGLVYPINDYVVAKVLNGYGFSKGFRAISKEITINKQLSENGIPVPRIYGFLPPRKSPEFFADGWTLFMERIHGSMYQELDIIERLEVERQHSGYMKTIRDLGFLPNDAPVHKNNLFERKRQLLYLLDFTGWKFKPGSTIEPLIRI